MPLAPIALFVYNRPDHTRQTVESLAENNLATASDLFIFSDGPKKPEAATAVAAVRECLRSIRGFKSVTITDRPENYGLARSVISGVTELVNRFGRVIVLEDDMLFSRGFLDYHNRALTKYENDEKVMQISGHVFPFPRVSEGDDAYFMPLSTSQGWSTWKRAWDLFDPEVKGAERLSHDRAFKKKFDLDGTFPYSTMLTDQLQGKVDSWAIRWWWSFFVHDGLCLYPRKSLLVNIGFDTLATHTSEADRYYNDAEWSAVRMVKELPVLVVSEESSFERVKAYLLTRSRPSVISMVFIFVNKMILRWTKRN